ncbi:6217_t:CDS:2 [Paraglomus occultum]|uniref:Oxidoreductase NAD-binding domain-containing protein 1 n=1 Tax=Paraglomus occultum TaxID=144539 RepID=A0A9N8YW17_9GLOM|nr:6217_t:CDS:2 [Paraglomus occultum]
MSRQQQRQQSNILNLSTTHLERTSHIQRQKSKIPATIISITQETPTIKSFLFSYLSPTKITFLPGQWLDVFIPNIPTVGGFSLTSHPLSPHFQLAVKHSTHPPAKWFHEEAKVGDVVEVRVGGDFVWNEEEEKNDETRSVVMIAGGVGINPLMSMLDYICECGDQEGILRDIRLLYSAKTYSELLFLERIENLRKNWNGNMVCTYYITKEESMDSSNSESEFAYGMRISKDVIDTIVDAERDHSMRSKWFICGPPSMEDDIIGWLRARGIEEGRIKFEKWW